jgi:hypothetical protein
MQFGQFDCSDGLSAARRESGCWRSRTWQVGREGYLNSGHSEPNRIGKGHLRD